MALFYELFMSNAESREPQRDCISSEVTEICLFILWMITLQFNIIIMAILRSDGPFSKPKTEHLL